ncbi:MAG: AI-2E family transporter, partial [Microbacterium sp.]
MKSRRSERPGPAASTTTPAASPSPSRSEDRGTRVLANLNRPFVIGFLVTFGGLTALALGAAISSLVTIWIYIAFALFAALGLDPIVRRLERHGTKRTWAIVIVYFAFAVVLVGVLWLIIPTVVSQVAQFVKDLPTMVSSFQRTDLYAWLHDQFGAQVPELLAEVQKFLTNPANIATIGGGVLQIGISIGTSISGFIIIIVLSLYFLATLPEIKQAFYRMVPARSRALTADLTDA